MEWYQILGIVLTIVFSIWGVKRHIAKLMKEGGEVLTVFGKAIEDGTITSEEAAEIFKEAKDVMDAWAGLLAKLKSR